MSQTSSNGTSFDLMVARFSSAYDRIRNWPSNRWSLSGPDGKLLDACSGLALSDLKTRDDSPLLFLPR